MNDPSDDLVETYRAAFAGWIAALTVRAGMEAAPGFMQERRYERDAVFLIVAAVEEAARRHEADVREQLAAAAPEVLLGSVTVWH